MKKFLEVEKDRKAYHANPDVNTVHRSSLLVPVIKNTNASVTFLNHFLLKRGYENVGCKLTAIDSEGNKIQSKLFEIDRPIVYNFILGDIFQDSRAAQYIVEFFSSKNLFIPFPAVMINYFSDEVFNQVHSFNRVLNDVFEDDIINSSSHPEASIDFIQSDNISTFLIYTSGLFPVNDLIKIELINGEMLKTLEVPIEAPRLTSRKIDIRSLLPNFSSERVGSLKVSSKNQHMFYGRLLVGHEDRKHRFTANHSFYDSSSSQEYWENDAKSIRTYPFFRSLQNIVRFHPIMSPSHLELSVSIVKNDSEVIFLANKKMKCPGTEIVEFNVNELLAKAGIDGSNVASFFVEAKPMEGNSPTRINHQLVYGHKDNLMSSINISLFNSNIYQPKNKKSFSWGQAVVSEKLDSNIGVVFNSHSESSELGANINLKFYSEDGFLFENTFMLSANLGKAFELKVDFKSELERYARSDVPQYIWYVAESDVYGMSVFSVTTHEISGVSSGEHGF